MIEINPYEGENHIEACMPEAMNLEEMIEVLGVPSLEDIAALYEDNCGDVIVTYEANINGDDCKWIMDIRYDVKDECGNEAESIKLWYHGFDTTAPVIECPVSDAQNPINLGSSGADSDDIPALINFLIENVTADAEDNCDETVTTANWSFLAADVVGQNQFNEDVWLGYVDFLGFNNTDSCGNEAEACRVWVLFTSKQPVVFSGDVCKFDADIDGTINTYSDCSDQFIPEGDSSNDKLSGDIQLDFIAYPVPFDREVNIKYNFEFDTNVTIQVFDTKGLLVLTETHNNYRSNNDGATKLDLSRGGDQVFYVTVTTNRGSVTKKVVSSNAKF